MRLPTIVENYIIAAIKRAEVEFSEDSTVGAYVPDFPGIVAFGADVHECARNVYVHLEEWVRTALRQGYSLPVLDTIDLNADADSLCATYHGSPAATTGQSDFFDTEEALEKAFRHFDEIAELASHGAA
jgi:predicted RNase H-like HicB family nuclease